MTFLKYLYAINLVINMQYRVSQKDLNDIILFNRLRLSHKTLHIDTIIQDAHF